MEFNEKEKAILRDFGNMHKFWKSRAAKRTCEKDEPA